MRVLFPIIFLVACTGDDGPVDDTDDTDVEGPVGGEVLSTLTFGGNGYDLFADTVATEDGGFYSIGGFSALAPLFVGDPGGVELESEGDADLYVARHDATGAVQWLRTIGSPSGDDWNSLSLTPDGGVMACGYVGNDVVVSVGEPDEVTPTTVGPLNGLAVEYDADGQLVDSWTVTSPTTSYFQTLHTCMRTADHVILGGIADGEVQLFPDHSSLATTLTTESADSFLTLVDDTDGTTTWFAGPGPQTLIGGAKLSDGSLVMVGGFTGEATIGEGDDAIDLTATSGEDTVLVRVDANGVPIWAISGGGEGDDYQWGIDVGPDDTFAVTGAFEGELTVPGGSETLTPIKQRDGYAAVYEADGTLSWVRQIGGTSKEHFIYGVELLDDGTVAVNGTVGWCGATPMECSNAAGKQKEVVFSVGEDDEVTLETSHGFGEMGVAAWDIDGNLLWASITDSEVGGFGRGIAESADGTLLVAGEFAGEVTLGEDTAWEVQLVSLGGGYDGLLMEVRP